MKMKIYFISSIIGVLEVLRCIQAVPIQAFYTGDSCDCQKRLNYYVNMPQPLINENYQPSEYGYKLDWPRAPMAKMTYSFDFEVEEAKTPSPPPELKLDLYAKIDRIMAQKKDCSLKEEVPKACGCQQCAISNRYLSSETSGERYTRNLRHPNQIDDNVVPSTSHIMAIILAPFKESQLAISKTRHKRDLSRIFIRPRKNTKRSERFMKQYSKRLQEVGSGKSITDHSQKPVRSIAPTGIRPLQQLKSFLNLPGLRNKRDIKGEYDLIEKEREPMDLTLPEVIQYMPETLDPDFQENKCSFGKCCQQQHMLESTTKGSTTTTSGGGTNKIADSLPNGSIVTDDENNEKKMEEKLIDNSVSLMHKKRNTAGYSGGCPSAQKCNNPTPTPTFNYEPLTCFNALHRPFDMDNNSRYPVPQYLGPPPSSQSSPSLDNVLVGAAYPEPSIKTISNAQLDQVIAQIVRRHSDFIQASSHLNGALVDPPYVQEGQAHRFLKSLMAPSSNKWFGPEMLLP